MEELSKTKQKLKRELSDFLGIEPDDIDDEDSLTEGLHMTPTDLTDFMQILNMAGFDTENLDLTEIESFSDLAEALNLHQ